MEEARSAQRVGRSAKRVEVREEREVRRGKGEVRSTQREGRSAKRAEGREERNARREKYKLILQDEINGCGALRNWSREARQG